MPTFMRQDAPYKSPTRCLSCGETGGPVCDLCFMLHGYGQVYLCQSCGWDVGRVFGMVDHIEHERKVQAWREVVAENNELHDQIAALEAERTILRDVWKTVGRKHKKEPVNA